MSVICHMILRFSHLVCFTRSEYTFKPLTFAATKKAHHHYCQSNEVYDKNLMRHLGCWLIYPQNVSFIFRLLLAALKCCLIHSMAERGFYRGNLQEGNVFHSGMSIEINSFQSMLCESEMLQHVNIQNRSNDSASTRGPYSRLKILHVGFYSGFFRQLTNRLSCQTY